MIKRAGISTLLLILASSSANSQGILKHEPGIGTMRKGMSVLVDNGKCPAGQVMQVTAGTINNRTGRTSPRGRDCVARP